VQETVKREHLGVLINRLEPGFLFSKTKDPEGRIEKAGHLFQECWQNSVELKAGPSQSGVLGLVEHISREFAPSESWFSEESVSRDLYCFLLGAFDEGAVDIVDVGQSQFRVRMNSGPAVSVLVRLVFRASSQDLAEMEEEIERNGAFGAEDVERVVVVVAAAQCPRRRVNTFKSVVDRGTPSCSRHLVAIVEKD
jgi:hypothetical protein